MTLVTTPGRFVSSFIPCSYWRVLWSLMCSALPPQLWYVRTLLTPLEKESLGWPHDSDHKSRYVGFDGSLTIAVTSNDSCHHCWVSELFPGIDIWWFWLYMWVQWVCLIWPWHFHWVNEYILWPPYSIVGYLKALYFPFRNIFIFNALDYLRFSRSGPSTLWQEHSNWYELISQCILTLNSNVSSYE